MEEREEKVEPNSQHAVFKQQLHKHKMTQKIPVRNCVLFKRSFSCSSSQGVRIHRGQTLSTPGDLQSNKKRKKGSDSHTFFFSLSYRSLKWPEISKKADPTYRNEENWVIKADH